MVETSNGHNTFKVKICLDIFLFIIYYTFAVYREYNTTYLENKGFGKDLFKYSIPLL